MPNVPTSTYVGIAASSAHVVAAQIPAVSGAGIGGDITIASDVYGLAQPGAFRTPAQRIKGVFDVAHDVLTVAVPYLAPYLQLEKLAGDFAMSAFASDQARVAKRRLRAHLVDALNFAASAGLPGPLAARFAAARVGVNPETVFPLGDTSAQYNPRTRASDSLLGLALDYGGPEADALRGERARQIEAELAMRPNPAGGATLGPFVALHGGSA